MCNTALLSLYSDTRRKNKRCGCCGVEIHNARGPSQSAIGSIVDGLLSTPKVCLSLSSTHHGAFLLVLAPMVMALL